MESHSEEFVLFGFYLMGALILAFAFLLLMVLLARWIIGTSHIIRLLREQNELIEKQSKNMEIVANALRNDDGSDSYP